MAQQTKDPEAPTTVRKVKAGHASQPRVMEVKTDPTDLVPWDLDTTFSVMGGRYPRLEALDKATGRAKYTYDISLPGMLWARMLRAPMPAADILGIDASRAEALPGVKAVWTTDARRVRFAGQDIAAVAAVSQEIAEDAARLIQVRYQPLPFVTDMQTAMKDGAPLVFEKNELPEEPENEPDARRKGNLVGPNVSPRGKRGDLAKGLAEAEVVHEGTYTLPVHTHCCLETHGVVARWEGERLTVWASTQGVFAVRNGLADALKVDRKNVTVLTEHMGGGFGSKLGPSATGSAFAVVACKLARQAGAPVKLMLGRQEEQVCTGNAPSAQMTVRIGARRDGTFTAIHFRSFGSAGVADGAGFGGPA
jgi:xanthine dehydrogenase YagR molybdenum-binding subunit